MNQLESLTGGCLCGAVRYEISGEPVWSAHCHCRSCQKALGASFATWSKVKAENFAVTRGRITVCETSPGVFVLLSPETEKGKEKIPQRFKDSWKRAHKEMSLLTEQRTFPDDGRDADAYVLWIEEGHRADEAA